MTNLFRLLVTAALVAAAGMWLLEQSEVDNELTDADRTALAPLMRSVEQKRSMALPTPDRELAHIQFIVSAVFERTQGGKDIPQGQPREPADVLAARSPLCYDRSRLIEKALRAAGFATRHVSMYTVRPGSSALVTLLTPNAHSHAITEVRTAGGWMLVDPSAGWLARDAQGRPLSARSLAQHARDGVQPMLPDQQSLPTFYRQPFHVVYGLYSRHGRFYPPYTAVPDVSLAELTANWQP